MALTFPSDLTTAHKWRRARLRPMLRQELSRTRGGALLAADLGHALWTADFESQGLPELEAGELMADFDALGGSLRNFLAHPAHRRFPAAAASSAGIGTGSIASIGGNRDTVTISGLPNGLVVSKGDMCSVTTAAGGYEFFEFTEGGTVSVGSTPSLGINPPLRASVTTGRSAELVDPLIELKLEPGTLQFVEIGLGKRAVAWRAIQVIT